MNSHNLERQSPIDSYMSPNQLIKTTHYVVRTYNFHMSTNYFPKSKIVMLKNVWDSFNLQYKSLK